MSAYTLQKLIRSINSDPAVRTRFMASPADVVAETSLSPEEGDALRNRDYGALYRLGVHGLLLRPFSILYDLPEVDYLAMIRKGAP